MFGLELLRRVDGGESVAAAAVVLGRHAGDVVVWPRSAVAFDQSEPSLIAAPKPTRLRGCRARPVTPCAAASAASEAGVGGVARAAAWRGVGAERLLQARRHGAGIDRARERTRRDRSPSMVPTAAAAPKVPLVPVVCQ
jgi:hypothetical protein